MRRVQTIEDIYSAVEDLIVALNASNHAKLAATLEHRMHRVAWTARSELFEELQRILTSALESEQPGLPEIMVTQVKRVLEVIASYLGKPA